MKIVVIGGSGLIGSKVVQKLGADGHQAVAASPDSGVNSVTGEGVAEVLEDAAVVIDVKFPVVGGHSSPEVLRNINP